ncbi:alpha/beta fold hydrolase [Bacillus sp. AK031]
MQTEIITLDNKLKVLVNMWGLENRTTLILLHGLGSTGKSFDELASTLSKDFKILAFDLPGHGKSSFFSDEEFFSMESLADWVMDILNYFNIRDYHIIGHSLGAYIGLTFAKKYSLKSLILLDGGYIQSSNLPNNSLKEEISLIRRHIETYTFRNWEEYEQEQYNNGLTNMLVELSKNSMKCEDDKVKLIIPPDVAVHLTKQMFREPSEATLSNIDTSVLLLRSTLPDDFNSIRTSETDRLKKHLKVRVKEVNEATHDIYWDKPRIVCNEILKWINS